MTFTVTVVNAGPSPATGVAVTDALPLGLTLVSATASLGTYTAPTWTVGTLSETGTPATLTIVATVTAPGALVHTATITQQTELDPNGANNSASVTLNAAESANLTVTKALTRASPHVGELLTFNVSVANQGPSPATGVAVTDLLPAGLAFESAAASQGAYDSATGVWTVGSIANTGSAGLTLTARVTQAGTVTNTASVTASDQPDPDLTDNSATVTLTTETIADLAVTKTLTGSAIPGLATTYTIVVTNLGPSPVTAASVNDLFPAALVAPAWTCTADAGSSCAAAAGTGTLATTVTLEAGDHATFAVTGTIATNATGLLVNTATVTPPAGAVDGDTTNNTATSSATLTPSADLQITKAGPANAVAGTNVIYTMTVTNAGPSDAVGVVVADPTPPGLTFVSTTGACATAFPCALGIVPAAATRTITATFAIPSGYTTPNPIANTATVSSLTPDAATGNNSATTNTPVAASVTDLRITKSNGVNGVIAGDTTTYTITITNPTRAERRDWGHGHRYVPDDADRRHVDLCRHRRRHLRRRREWQHQHVRDRAGRRDCRLHRDRHGRSRGHGRPRELGAGGPARRTDQPYLGKRHRQRPHHRPRRPGPHQDRAGVDRRRQPAGLHDHGDQSRAVGRRGRRRERSDCRRD